MGSVVVSLDLKKVGEVDSEWVQFRLILLISLYLSLRLVSSGAEPRAKFCQSWHRPSSTVRFRMSVPFLDLLSSSLNISWPSLEPIRLPLSSQHRWRAPYDGGPNSQPRSPQFAYVKFFRPSYTPLTAIIPESSIIPKALSLTQNLVERVSRLQWLMRFINDNAALSRMSEGCRWTLCSDAEKVESAKALWARLQEHHKGEVSLLRQAIETYEKTRPGSLQEEKPDEGVDADMEGDNTLQGTLDTIRAWVKWCARDCATLVECIASTVRDGGARSATTVKGRKLKPGVNADVAADGAAIILVGPNHSSLMKRICRRTLSAACHSFGPLPKTTWTVSVWIESRTSCWIYVTMDGR